MVGRCTTLHKSGLGLLRDVCLGRGLLLSEQLFLLPIFRVLILPLSMSTTAQAMKPIIGLISDCFPVAGYNKGCAMCWITNSGFDKSEPIQ
eukprot:4425425-Amphidinium_carterae.1